MKRIATWLLLPTVGFALAAACSSEVEEGNNPIPDNNSNYTVGNPPGTGCSTEGAEQECKVDLSDELGQPGCFNGKQICEGGQWTECLESAQAKVLIGPGCPTDSCDPDCHQFDEPQTPAIINSGTGAPAGGAVNGLPGGFQNGGLPSPCNTMPDDCQFDHWCDAGNCVPHLNNDQDPIGGWDVTMPVPCSDVPLVCNRGDQPTPPGLQVTVTNGDPSDLGECGPGTQGTIAGSCDPITGAIAPGSCVQVTNCTGLTGNKTLVVNHQDFPGYDPAETECANNWSVYDNNGTCVCQAGTTSITSTPVAMYILLDNSISMNDGSPDKWDTAVSSLTSFYQSPSSAGLNVAYKMWPVAGNTACNSTSVCNPDTYATPDVPVGTLTVDSAPTDAHEALLISVLGADADALYTPMGAALQGGLDWAEAYELANPGEKAVVILITDGDPTCTSPTGCGDKAFVESVAQNGLNNQGIETYTIGMPGADNAFLQDVADAGDGLFFNASNTTQFINAMVAIQFDALPCQIDFADPSLIDPTAVTISYDPSGAAPAYDLVEGADINDCPAPDGTGSADWYLDNPGSPNAAVLCPATCSTINGDVGGSVSIDIGCAGAFTTDTYTYDFNATCPVGSTPVFPRWNRFAYDTTIPTGASVVFDIKTATTPADFPNQPYVTVANAPTDTADVVPLSTPIVLTNPETSPPPSGIGPYSQAEHLRLQVTLNPTPDGQAGPSVNGWDLLYSCQASE